MNRILFVSRRDDRKDYDTAVSMSREVGSQNSSSDIAYDSCFLEDITFIFKNDQLQVLNTQTSEDISNYDGVFLLGWFKLRRHEDVALAISLYIQAKGKKVLNSEALFNRSRSKISQYVLCALHDIPIAPFVCISDIGAQQSELSNLVADNLEFPVIVKSITASRGRDNYLARNMDELKQAVNNSPTKVMLAQTFIPNDGDYRLLVMDKKVSLAIHRQADNNSTHLNNTSQGANAKLVDIKQLDQQMLEDSIKIATLLRREVTGVDMIVDRQTGNYFFLEANNMPQLSTGSFVAEKTKALDEFFINWVKANET